MKTKYLDLYKTKDIFIASTLYSSGEKIDSTEWIDNECFFIFEDTGRCEEIAKKYYQGNLTVNPRNLFDSFKTIKSLLFNH